jgi:hypothetical protein
MCNSKRNNAARAADAAGTQKTAAEYDQANSLRDLNSRLNANVIPGAWNGKDAFGADRATAMIHPDFLRTMHDNPEIGAAYEKKINDWAEIDAGVRQRMAAQGNTITSLGMSVDKNGTENYHMAGVMTGGSPDKPEMTKVEKDKDDKKTPKELMEELLEKLAEKRQEEKAEAKRAADAEASDNVDVIA